MIEQLPDLEPEDSKIQFFYQDIEWQIEDAQYVTEWLTDVAVNEGKLIHQLSIVFMTDDGLLEMNRQYLDHDYYTDIITFPLNSDPILAELYISIDRVRENANSLEVDFDHELKRVMVHGVLHLLGYGDKTDEETKQMRAKEDLYIEMYKK